MIISTGSAPIFLVSLITHIYSDEAAAARVKVSADLPCVRSWSFDICESLDHVMRWEDVRDGASLMTGAEAGLCCGAHCIRGEID